jgi:hypothetical protein
VFPTFFQISHPKNLKILDILQIFRKFLEISVSNVGESKLEKNTHKKTTFEIVSTTRLDDNFLGAKTLVNVFSVFLTR